MESRQVFREPQHARPCIFELIYFAKPNSTVDGESVYDLRKRLGERLAKEAPCEADLVSPIPDSGVPAAIGYAQKSKLPYEMALIRSHFYRTHFHRTGTKDPRGRRCAQAFAEPRTHKGKARCLD